MGHGSLFPRGVGTRERIEWHGWLAGRSRSWRCRCCVVCACGALLVVVVDCSGSRLSSALALLLAPHLRPFFFFFGLLRRRTATARGRETPEESQDPKNVLLGPSQYTENNLIGII